MWADEVTGVAAGIALEVVLMLRERPSTAIALGTATTTTALVYFLLTRFGADVTPFLKAFGSGSLIAMAAETVIPEAFHNGPRYSGVIPASGFAAVILLKGTVQ